MYQKFKDLVFGLDELDTDVVECCRKLASWRKVVDAISLLVNAKGV